MVPTYTVDLDQPPEMRWQELITDKKADVSTLSSEYTFRHNVQTLLENGKMEGKGTYRQITPKTLRSTTYRKKALDQIYYNVIHMEKSSDVHAFLSNPFFVGADTKQMLIWS